MNICREMNVALKRAVLCFIPLGSRSLRQLCSLLGQDTTLRDGDTGKQLVQLLFVAGGNLKMTGDDPGLLVASIVSSQLEDLSSQVLEDCGTNTFGIVALAEKTMDSADLELETSTG